MDQKVIVGVCARNEEKSIKSCLDKVLPQVREMNAELVVCVNGSSDNTLVIVHGWFTRNQLDISNILVRRRGNLIEAQRAIFEHTNCMGSVWVFVDADIVIDTGSLRALTLEIEKNHQAVIAYGRNIPIKKKKQTLIEKAYCAYLEDEIVFSPRKYLRGQMFAVKSWFGPEPGIDLIVDDIFMSYKILYEYGEVGILEVKKATYRHVPLDNYSDFYKSFRRKYIEVERCFRYFPHFRTLKREYTERRFSLWKLLWVPGRQRCHLVYYIVLLYLSKIRFCIEKIFNRNTKNSKDQSHWEPVLSTKQGLHEVD